MPENVFRRMLSWLRAGYPTGVPQSDYIALLGVLHRQLTDEEVQHLAEELYRTEQGGEVPVEQIREAIRSLTLQKPTEDDVRRVSAHLAAGGWPLSDLDELKKV